MSMLCEVENGYPWMPLVKDSQVVCIDHRTALVGASCLALLSIIAISASGVISTASKMHMGKSTTIISLADLEPVSGKVAHAQPHLRDMEVIYLAENQINDASADLLPLLLSCCKCLRLHQSRERPIGESEFDTFQDIQKSEPEGDIKFIAKMRNSNSAVAERIIREACLANLYACKSKGDCKGALAVLTRLKAKELEPSVLDLCMAVRACQNAHQLDIVAELLAKIRKVSSCSLRFCEEVQAEVERKDPPRPPPFVQRSPMEIDNLIKDPNDPCLAMHDAQKKQELKSILAHLTSPELKATQEVDRLLMINPRYVDAIQARARERLSRAAEPPRVEDLLLVDFAPDGPQQFVGVSDSMDLRDIDPGEHVYVVSLARRPSKRMHVLRELRRARLRAYIMDAVDGDAVETQADVTRCGCRVMPGYVGHTHHHRPFTTGEFGCFMSHWCIYEKMARENISCALILEDDFNVAQEPKSHFRARVGDRVRQAAMVDGGWDILYLGHDTTADRVTFPAPNLVDPGYAVWTVGYVIRRSGALKLLAAEGKRNMAPLDAYLSLFRGRPIVKPYWFHDRAQEYCSHIPGALEGELRGLGCYPPLVMPSPDGIMLSDTAKLRKNTRFLRDLPEGGSSCVVESLAVANFWKTDPPAQGRS